MSFVQYVLHTVNAVMFGCALYIHIRGYADVSHCKASSIIKRLGKNVMLAGMAVCSLFILLQIDWVLQGHNVEVGNATSWSWLLFDYGLALYLLINGTLVRVFAQWRGRQLQTSGKTRRHTDAMG